MKILLKLKILYLNKRNSNAIRLTVVVVSAGHGSAGVSLAGVESLLAGADHGGSVHVASVGVGAVGVGDDGHVDGLQRVGRGAARGEGAPAGDARVAARLPVLALLGHRHHLEGTPCAPDG